MTMAVYGGVAAVGQAVNAIRASMMINVRVYMKDFMFDIFV